MPQCPPRCRKPRVGVQHFMVTIKTCWLMRLQESKGDEGGEIANDDEISPGGWQVLWMIPSSTKRLICAFQHECGIINGIMFVVGKRRRYCLRFLPLLPAISISLQPSFHMKSTVPVALFPLSPFCSLHLIKQIGYIQLRWMGAKWIQPMSRKREEMMVVQHTYSVLLLIISMSSPLSRFSMPGAIDRMTKRST